MQGSLDSIEVLDSRLFQVVVRRLADSLSYGTDHSPFLGSGIEYVQSRPYQAGDSVRAVDWRVTARTGRFHVKEYEAPKSMPVYMLLDTSASMVVSSIQKSKYALALYLAGGIALACLDRVSPVGVLGVGERSMLIRPSLSKSQIMTWLLALRHFRYDEATNLGRRISELSPSLRSRALVLVFSDLHDEACMPALKRLSQRHDCAVVQLKDPAEDSLRGAGFLRAKEAETGRVFSTHGKRRHLDQDIVNAELRRAGIDHLTLSTDQPYVHSVRHFFESRGLLGRGAR